MQRDQPQQVQRHIKNSRPKNSDVDIIYDHILYWVQQESPPQLIERFQKLFIDGIGYPDPEIESTLYKIIPFLENQQEFNHIISRCCYILINRWQMHPKRKSAIPDLVDLFRNSSSRFPHITNRSHLVRRLQELILNFTQSEDYQIMQRLLPLVRNETETNQKAESSSLGQLICRYPFLYNHCLIPESSSDEQQQIIQEIQGQKQRQFEVSLSHYMLYWMRQANSKNQDKSSLYINKPQVYNPTLLSDEELYRAVQEFVGKVEKSSSYQVQAKRFLERTKTTRYYRDFKNHLYEYLIESVEVRYGKHQFNQRLYNFLKSTFPESDHQKLDEFLIMRTCSHLFNFLVESPQNPNYYLFIDMISNLGPRRTIGLLLKIVLLSSKAKPHLEQRFSLLFNYYESQSADEIRWLIKSLENLNVALVTNFGNVDLSFMEKEMI